MTAGNASGINDGAAALVVTTREKAERIGTPPLARILAYASTGVDPTIMGMGPVPAVRLVLARADLTIDAIDLFELNEAFAAQSLAVMRELQARSGQGQRQRRRDRARSSDRRQRRPRAHDARPRAACQAAALRRGVAVHRRRHGHRDGGGGVIAVRIVPAVLAEIAAHARAASPDECCGLLLGTTTEIVDAVRSANLADDPTRRFLIDPRTHFDARRARAASAASRSSASTTRIRFGRRFLQRPISPARRIPTTGI